MRWLEKGRCRFLRSQRGFSLIEVLVAVAILAAIGVAFLSALTTGSRSVGIQDEQVMAESLARTQLEEIKFAPYAVSYNVTVTMPSQYYLSIESPYVFWNDVNSVPPDTWMESVADTKLQKITVRVTREGGKPVLAVEALKKE